jgi:hypothetical protein
VVTTARLPPAGTTADPVDRAVTTALLPAATTVRPTVRLPAHPAVSTARRKAAVTPTAADPAVLRTGTAARAARAAPVAAHGTGMHSMATSTEPRGATAPHPGAWAQRHGPVGADRTRLPEAGG